jgi:hypothetical protein
LVAIFSRVELTVNSKFPIVAGILQIAVAFTILFLSMRFYVIYRGVPDFGGSNSFVVLGLFGLWTFVSGLAGGLLAIMREHFYITILGDLLSMCWGLVYEWIKILVWKAYVTSSEVIIGMQACMTILLPILILAFLLSSRTEFK